MSYTGSSVDADQIFDLSAVLCQTEMSYNLLVYHRMSLPVWSHNLGKRFSFQEASSKRFAAYENHLYSSLNVSEPPIIIF